MLPTHLSAQAATPVGMGVQAWGLLAAVGAQAAPFYLMVLLCAAYRLFCLPMPSSFATGKGARASEREMIQVSQPLSVALRAHSWVTSSPVTQLGDGCSTGQVGNSQARSACGADMVR